MKVKISIGSIIFWGFIAWIWIGDTVTDVFHEITKTAVVATVDGKKTVIDVDKLIDNAVKKAESVIESVEKEESKPEPTNPDEGKEMIASEKEDDRYGNQDDRW